jgi:hypothetical protein
VLGVAPGATPDELKSAWRREVLRNHPDRNPNDPVAAQRFQNVQDAYHLLSGGAGSPATPPPQPQGRQRASAGADWHAASGEAPWKDAAWRSAPHAAADQRWRLMAIPVFVLALVVESIHLTLNPYTGAAQSVSLPLWVPLLIYAVGVAAGLAPPRWTKAISRMILLGTRGLLRVCLKINGGLF